MSRHASPFPAVFTIEDYDEAIRALPTADLLAEIEAARWLALEVATRPDDSRTMAEIQLDTLLKEVERRQRLMVRHAGDPLAPVWPRRDTALRDRVQAVKDQWPIERFAREVLLCELKPVAGGDLLGHCPLPGHDDSTPSFRVYADGHAHCFGCGRGGDVIKLAGYFFGYERFTESIGILESMSGLGRAA